MPLVKPRLDLRVPKSQARIVILGIGDDGLDGLTDAARRTLQGADLVLGAEATLRLLAQVPGKKLGLDPDMSVAVNQVREALYANQPVLVSQGDPLFYGVARYLVDRVGKDHFEVVPHVSSMQLAFARVKESWEDAYLASLAGRPLESLIDRIRTAEKVGLFSSDDCPPSRLARALLDHGIDDYRAYVCERLGQPDERVTQATLAELAELSFEPLHVLILVREPGRPDRAGGSDRLLFGNPDDAFAQSQPKRGLITQAEVRSIALSQLNLRPRSIVWDIGAGTGSVSIEAAQLASEGTVYAIEPDPADLALLAANCESFGVPNVKQIAGRAPEALESLPDPDAVFVGGTGRHVADVVRAAFARLKTGGRLAVNVATLEALVETRRLLRSLGTDVRVTQVSVARGIDQLERLRLQASNPTFLLVVRKPS
jgi:precorrin-6Y C5,15-methyltransferase (decarboxylating)